MKAIIMAGGEGTRLRPLTCDYPKPMLPLMNRPVMEYALELLRRHGIEDVAVTLGYLPDAVTDRFGDGDAWDLRLRYYVERTPLGTAGGVRQAADFLDETFIVLSGDGITDLDITAALAFHREKRALATLVLKRVDEPLEYGVVVTDGDGRVSRFLEKPDWSDVAADTVNTGIYILEPEALGRVPEGWACDFGRELFPAMVREGLPVFGYGMEGYWCDIGDVRAYLKAHMDAMEGRIHLDGLSMAGNRVAQLPGARVDRAAVLEGPCVIGPEARVEAGARVGPGSVLGRGCLVGQNASVKRSVLWDGATLEAGAQARGCVLGRNARMGEGAQAYDGCVLGAGASLGPRAALVAGARLWPGRRAAPGERVDANRVWEDGATPAFRHGRMDIAAPEAVSRFTQALCADMRPRELLLGRRGDDALARWHAAAAGAMAQGCAVLDAGPCTLPMLSAAVRRLGADAALLVAGEGLVPLNALGARLTADHRRAVLNLYARQDFDRPFRRIAPPVRTLGDSAVMFAAEAARRFSANPADAPAIALFAEDPLLRDMAARACGRARLTVRVEADEARMALAPGEVGLFLNEDGERFTMADEGGALTEAEGQMLVAWTALRRGARELLLPVSATRAVEALANARDARVTYVAGDDTVWMNRLATDAPDQLALHFDGISASLAALSALAEAGLSLADWRAGLPDVHRRGRSVPLPLDRTGRILSALASREDGAELGGGLRFRRNGGWAWVCPDEAVQGFRVVAEAASAETARELCDFCEAELRRLSGGRGESPKPGHGASV